MELFVAHSISRHLLLKKMAFIVVGLLFSQPLFAFQFGNMDVPKNLAVARDLIIINPARCISQLKDIRADAKLENSNVDGQIKENSSLLQLLALCELKQEQYDQALEIIDENNNVGSIEPYSKQTVALITALVYARMGGKEKIIEAQNLLLSSLKELKIRNGSTVEHLRYQLSRELGRLYSISGNYLDAEKFLQLAHSQAEMLHNKLLVGWADFFLGDYYNRIGQSGRAMSLYSDAKQRGEGRSVQSQYLAALATKRIAVTYHRLKDFSKALPSAQKSVQLFQKLGNKQKQVGAYLLLAEIYLDHEKYNLALVQYINALELAKLQSNSLVIANIRKSIASIYIQQGNYTEAQVQLAFARKEFDQLKDKSGLQSSLMLLGELYLKRGETAMASQYLISARKLSQDDGIFEGQDTILKLLAESYESKSYYKKALGYYKQYQAAKEVVSKADIQLKQVNFEQQYQLVEQQKLIRKLKHDAQTDDNLSLQLKLLTFFLCALTLFVVMLLVVLRKRTFQLTTTNKHLLEQLSIHPMTGMEDENRYPGGLIGLFNDFPLTEPVNPDMSKLCVAVIKLDCFADIYETRGGIQSDKILSLLGRFVQSHFKNIRLYHLRDDLLLAVCQANTPESSLNFAQLLVSGFSRFCQQVRLPPAVSIGICSYPFLPHAPTALSEKRTLELAYVALQGAKQLQLASSKPEWVELRALNCMHPAFIGGEVRTQARQAIQKGLIKVNYAGDRTILEW